MTEADRIQSLIDIDDKVTFVIQGDTRITASIEKLNRKTATVRQGSIRWRVPYSLLGSPNDQVASARRERLLDVAREARELMDRHGLNDWSFRFNAARRTIGSCREQEKVIQLSRHHAANDPSAQVTDTILHEIAHALAGNAAGHGPVWKAIAERIGATPRASKPSDPAENLAVRSKLHPGDTVGFRSGRGAVLTGTVVKLNPKTVRVSSGEQTLRVPYGCIVLDVASWDSSAARE